MSDMDAITQTTTISIVSSSEEQQQHHGEHAGPARSGSGAWVTSGPDYPDAEWSHTTLNYYKDSHAPPPDTSNSALTEHQMRVARRGDDSPHVAPTPVAVRNIRGRETEYRIQKQGFQVAYLESAMEAAGWKDDAELKRTFFPEVDEMLQEVLGCERTVQYEWHVRSRTLEEALERESGGKVDIDGPVRRVHIDESPASARKEFAHHCPELAGRTFGIFNVWKPLKTVRRDPLALCDARTLKDEDLQSGKVTVPGVGEIENFSVRPPGKGREGEHAWQYLRGMEADEVYVFRIYDGRVDVGEGKRSNGVAHTSFVDPGTEGEEARESVEVRSFCVF